MLSPIRDIFSYIKMFQGYLGIRIYLIFVLSLFAAVSEGFGILMLLPLLHSLDGSAPTEGSDGGINQIMFDFINFLGLSNSTAGVILLITTAFIMKGIITFCALGFNAYLIGQLLRELKGRLFDHYTLMSYAYYSSKDTGHFTNLINEQPTKALESFNQLTIFGGQLINTFVLMVLAMFMTWQFGLMALCVGAILLIIFMNLSSYVRSLSRITAKENGNLTRWLIQTLHAFKYLTATGQTYLLKNNIMKSISRLTSNQVKTGVAAAFTHAVREPIAVVFIMLVVFLQILVLEQPLAPILVSIVLFYRALNATLAVQSAFQGTFQFIGSMELVHQEFIKQSENQVKDGEIQASTLSKSIQFRDVCFRYGNQDKDVISKMSVDFPVRNSVAIVGESGAGKSTLVDLISLIHDPQEGQVFIDGVPGNKINKSSWRSQIGYVSQETVIFDDTIANNICMWVGDPKTDEELMLQIKKAAHQANILVFINSLPDGFESLVGDRGVLLSGGQRQRLFIARELFRKPSLLILDEATSALDSASEKEIQNSIESLKGKITLIIIAHRLSTIKTADLIHVLEDGKLIESGTYKQLVEDDSSRFSKFVGMQKL